MKIDRIETINLLFEYEKGFTYAGGTCTGRVTTLVRVHTDDGQVGIGSGYSHPALLYLIIQDQLAPLLIGKDPREVETLWSLMYNLTRWYGRKGAAMTALGALDMAFWDLRGKSQGKPIYRLLGSERTNCAAYGSALLWRTPEELAAEARELIDRGFRRVKMRLGRGEETDVAAVEAVRNAIGGDHDLMVDGSMRYTPDQARVLAEFLAEQNVFWLEEPFTPEDLDAFVALREVANLPLAAGENEFGLQGFREMMRAGMVDIVQPDASRCGGITETVRVADLALEMGYRFATHTWSDAVTIVANAHVVSSRPNGVTVEIDQTGNPFIEELLSEPLGIRDGQIELSDQPGLGIELNEDTVERYRVADPLQTPHGMFSDMAFGDALLSPIE